MHQIRARHFMPSQRGGGGVVLLTQGVCGPPPWARFSPRKPPPRSAPRFPGTARKREREKKMLPPRDWIKDENNGYCRTGSAQPRFWLWALRMCAWDGGITSGTVGQSLFEYSRTISSAVACLTKTLVDLESDIIPVLARPSRSLVPTLCICTFFSVTRYGRYLCADNFSCCDRVRSRR